MNLQTLAQMVANCLSKLTTPDVWEYVQPEGENATDKWHLELWAKIAGPNGATITLHLDSHKKRIVVSGDYPRSNGNIYPYRDRPDSITVSQDREPAAIAKDIHRRYLSAYLEAYNRGKEQFDAHNNHEAGTDALVVRMCQHIGKEVYRSKHDEKLHRSYYIERQHTSGMVSMDIHGPNDVKLSFSVTEDMAKKVLDMLGTLQQSGE